MLACRREDAVVHHVRVHGGHEQVDPRAVGHKMAIDRGELVAKVAGNRRALVRRENDCVGSLEGERRVTAVPKRRAGFPLYGTGRGS